MSAASGPANNRKTEKDSKAVAGNLSGLDATLPSSAEPGAEKKLTAEEQMALYEKELKENDWGHQPC